ncbi:hypothetical protein AMTRI_Chr02g262970 [Amborella trichopoda]
MECGGVGEEEEYCCRGCNFFHLFSDGSLTTKMPFLSLHPSTISKVNPFFYFFHSSLSYLSRFLSAIISLSLSSFASPATAPLSLYRGLDLRAMCKEDGTARTRTHGESAGVPSRTDSPHECPHAWRTRTSALTSAEPARLPSRTESPHECPHECRARTHALTNREPARVPSRTESPHECPHERRARTHALTNGEPEELPSSTASPHNCPHTWRAGTSALTHGEPPRVPSRTREPPHEFSRARVAPHAGPHERGSPRTSFRAHG